jgi:hypothetical protein
VIFPLGSQPGKPIALKFLDDATGPIAQTISVPADAPPTMDIFAEQAGLTSPTPNDLCIDSCTNIFSNDTNHSTATAMRVPGDLPLALNGILGKPRQRDYYRISAKGKVPLDVKVIARQLRSPIDSVLYIFDAQGHPVARNDDQPGTPDSYLRFTPPVDGEYLIAIDDQLGRGGPDYVYRIEVTKATPSVTTSLMIPQLDKETILQTISVPRGNRYASVIRIYRNDFDGPLRLTCPDLPPGVKMIANPVAAGESVVPVIFQADSNAQMSTALCHLQADSLDPKMPLTGQFESILNLLEFNNNPLHQVRTDRLVVAVMEPAPVSIRVDAPKIPLLQDGTMDLHIHIDRQLGFKGPVRLQVAVFPKGLQPARVEVPPDKSDVTMSVGAEPNAPIGKTPICIRGTFENNGATMIAADFATLDVESSPFQMHLPNLRVAAGGSATVTCPIEQHEPLTGPATVQLLGLPPGCSANDVTLTGADKQAVFTITADPTTRTGTQPGIFLRISYTKSGDPVVLNLGRGTTIRVTSHRSASPPLASAKEGK